MSEYLYKSDQKNCGNRYEINCLVFQKLTLSHN